MNRYIYFLFVFLFAKSAFSQTIQTLGPPGFPTGELTKFSNDFQGYYVLTPSMNDNTKPRFMSIMDAEGTIVWFRSQMTPHIDTDFDFNVNTHQYSMANVEQGGDGPRRIRLDSNFQVIDTTRTLNGVKHDLHDFMVLSNGHKIILGSSDTIMDLTGHTFGESPGRVDTQVKYTVIQELSENDSLIYQWNGIHHISVDEFDGKTYNYRKNNFDYTHINAIDIDEDGNWVVSMRHTNSIFKIDRVNKTGNIIWRLGGKYSDFTFVGDTIPFSGQHYIRAHGNATYSLYDNGNAKEVKISRGLVYQLDMNNNTATDIFNFNHPGGAYGSATGNFQKIDEEKYIVGWGQLDRPYPSFTMVDNSGNIMVDFALEDSYRTYRAVAYNNLPAITRPTITCDSLNGKILLTAPDNYASYIWSTGEETQSILIDDNEKYAVWVNHGVGYMGSKPFTASDESNACGNLTQINEVLIPQSKEVKQIFDLAGREVDTPQNHGFYIILYKSGKTEKVIWDANKMGLK